jgi:phosphoglycerate-specific signal transduction histidine kinase
MLRFTRQTTLKSALNGVRLNSSAAAAAMPLTAKVRRREIIN